MKIHVIEILTAAQAADLLDERIKNIHDEIAKQLEAGNPNQARALVEELRRAEGLLKKACDQAAEEAMFNAMENCLPSHIADTLDDLLVRIMKNMTSGN